MEDCLGTVSRKATLLVGCLGCKGCGTALEWSVESYLCGGGGGIKPHPFDYLVKCLSRVFAEW